MTSRTCRLSHLLSWISVAVVVTILFVRAWVTQSGVHSDDLRSDSLANAFRFWRQGSLLLAVIGGVVCIFLGAHPTSRLARFGWMWAMWTAYLALIPPRIQNFAANGATSDDVFIYPPLVIFVVAYWAVARLIPAPGWLLTLVGFSLEALLGAALFNLFQGAGADDAISTSLWASATTMVAFVVSCAVWLLVRRRRSPTDEPGA